RNRRGPFVRRWTDVLLDLRTLDGLKRQYLVLGLGNRHDRALHLAGTGHGRRYGGRALLVGRGLRRSGFSASRIGGPGARLICGVGRLIAGAGLGALGRRGGNFVGRQRRGVGFRRQIARRVSGGLDGG